MAMQPIYGPGIMFPPSPGNVFVPAGANTVDASSETIQFIGFVCLEGGSASGPKTISSGGKIYFNTASVTFGAGTTLRVGIQDVSTGTAPAQGDGTFDVYKDFVGGTDTIAGASSIVATMTNGSKSLSHQQPIAIAFTLTARTSPDVVNIRSWSVAPTTGSIQLPATMVNSSGSMARSSGVPDAVIEFNDGTLGWITGSYTIAAQSSVAYNLNTAGADEYGNLFIPRFKVRAASLYGVIAPASASADAELCLYSDPLGTPTLIEAIAIDATYLGHSSSFGMFNVPFSTERILTPGTTYAATFRPTTANSITSYYHDVADSRFWKLNSLGDDCYAVNRLNNAGPFGDYNGGTAKTRRLWMSIVADQLDDGVGGGGGGGGMLQGNMRGNMQ